MSYQFKFQFSGSLTLLGLLFTVLVSVLLISFTSSLADVPAAHATHFVEPVLSVY